MKAHEDHGHDLNVKKVDRLSSTRVRLTMEYSGETVSKHESMTANRYMRIAKIPGFRPGKAPIKMVTERYKEEILKDVVSHLIEAGIAEAIEKTKLTPVSRPRLSKVNDRALGDKAPFEFQAEFDVQPEIELRHYKGVPLKAEDPSVSDEEVTKTLDNIRDKMASLEPVENAAPEKGHYAVVEVGYTIQTDPPKTQEPRSFTVELGEGRLLPELEKALLGMKVGDDFKEVAAKFPEDYDDKSLAGKDATFRAKILELKKKSLPELNDALAAQIRPGGTVESLQKEIRESILSSKTDEHRQEQRNQIVEYLIANHQFEVPQSLVERQMQSLLQWMVDDMRKRGHKPGPLKEDEIKMIRQRAEQMVRSSLLLKEIAQKEKISVDDEKVRQRVEALAAQMNQTPEQTEKLLDERGMLDRLRDEVLTDQVFDFLISNAQRVAGAPRP